MSTDIGTVVDRDEHPAAKVERLADELYATTMEKGTERLREIAAELWELAEANRHA